MTKVISGYIFLFKSSIIDLFTFILILTKYLSGFMYLCYWLPNFWICGKVYHLQNMGRSLNTFKHRFLAQIHTKVNFCEDDNWFVRLGKGSMVWSFRKTPKESYRLVFFTEILIIKYLLNMAFYHFKWVVKNQFFILADSPSSLFFWNPCILTG